MGVTGAASLLLGGVFFIGIRGERESLKTRDSYMLVILAWVFCSLFGAFPFFLSGQVPSFIDAIFESVSGYTTTGATVVIDDYMTPSLLLWKAITHWLGGMGILVFMIALLPALGIGGQKISSAEAPGPDISKIAPRAQDVAKLLYIIYIGLSVIEFLLLWASPHMQAFEALVNTLGSISTAGLYLHPGGIGYYDSLFVEIVISVFTILSGLSFAFYAALLKRDSENLRHNSEIKVYGVMLVVITVFITFDLYFHETYATVAECLRHSFFQVSAFMSTAGFVLDNYVHWPSFSKMLFLVMLFVGSCASSTGGGMKIIRFLTMLKSIRASIKSKLHPNAVTNMKIGEKPVTPAIRASIFSFLVLYFVTFLLGSLVLSIDNNGLETTFSACASAMSTTGIYLGPTGATGNYAIFSEPMRLFLSFLMVVGRLELFTVFLLFTPSFWNTERTRHK